MKKHILLPFVLGLGLFLFANPVKSQNFQIVASFGTAHNWAVPNAVLYEIDYYYPYHQIVHINREQRGRNLFYNVLLEDRGQFVELFFGRQAIILDINYFNRYPLAQHICSVHCGYHGNFYRAHQVACNHRNHGNRHNHIAYRSGRNYNSYAANNGAANRNVRASYRSNNSRNNARRNSSVRSSVVQNEQRSSSNSRISSSERVRSSSNSRTGNSANRSASSVRGNKNDSRNGSGRNSRTSSAVSPNSRN